MTGREDSYRGGDSRRWKSGASAAAAAEDDDERRLITLGRDAGSHAWSTQIKYVSRVARPGAHKERGERDREGERERASKFCHSGCSSLTLRQLGEGN